MPTDRAASPPATPWEARFGRLILQDGIAAIPLALFLYQARLGLSAQQVWFVSAILARRWSADLPYPSLAGLAAATGVSVRTLQYLRASLCARQYLAVYEGYDGTGRRTANSYDFAGLFAALEAVIAADGDAAEDLEAPELPPPAEPETGRSFLARYGRVIARKGIAAVPQALFSQQATLGLSPQQVWFVAYILGHRWTTALPHPSLRRMAQRTGYSERQIHNVKEELVARGYLRLVHRQGAGGGQDTNGYDFSALLAALQAHLSPLPVPPDATAPPDPLRDPAPESALPPRRGRRPPRAAAPGDGAEVRQSLAAEARVPVQHASVGVVQQASRGPVQEPSEGRMQGASAGSVQEPAGGASRVRRIPATRFRAESATEFGGAGASGFRRKESDHVESDHPDDSNRPTLPKAERGTRNAERPNAERGTAERGARKEERGMDGAPRFACRGPLPPPSPALDDATTAVSGLLPPSAFPLPRSEVPLPPPPTSLAGESRQDVGLLPPSAFRVRTSAYSPYIAGIILDYSREFGDGLHGPANVTQALRLWQASGLAETAFVDLLHEARQRVRLHQGKQGTGQIWNKMAYYYRVVAALLAAPPGGDAAPDPGVGGSWTD